MNDLQQNWKEVLEKLKASIIGPTFNSWFSNIIPLRIDKHKKILYIKFDEGMINPDYVIPILKNRYMSNIEKCVMEVFNDNLSVEMISEDEVLPALDSPYDDNFVKRFPDEYFLNPKYNFNSFVVGNNNRYAHAASLAVAESPACIAKSIAEAYNPLFLYGGSGLGKTHLMHAIGHHILSTYPQLKVLYVSSEMFTNELIKAITDRKTIDFRNKYRHIDVLLIDDIQFLENKDSTQEEFFHTFNTLYDANKQIVISSDRPPNKLLNIEERLRSRFQSNMIADIQPADYENRVAILLKKAEIENINVDDDLMEVITLIAGKIKTNIRELDGAFTRIMTFSNIMNKKINMSLAKEVLKEIISNADIIINADLIKKTVCKEFDIKVSDIESSNRSKSIAFPRQIAMYLCREMTDLSLKQIGQSFGKKDHTTVIHGCEKIANEIKDNEDTKFLVENIKRKINESVL